jgi:hypothetical protein
MSDPLSEEQLTVITERLRLARKANKTPHPPSAPINDWPVHYDHDVALLLADNDHLRVKLSQCSELFDKLSTQYHEARERWKQMMDRERAQLAVFRPIVEAVADVPIAHDAAAVTNDEVAAWVKQARAALEQSGQEASE